MLTCSKCGTVAPHPAPFCSSCGTSLISGGVMPAIPPPPFQTKTSGLAITGFVLSFVCGVLGLVFSLLGHREIKKSEGRITGDGFALAGIVISILSTAIAILMWWMVFRVASTIDKLVDEVVDESTPRMNLRAMAMRAEEYRAENGEFPTADFTPTQTCCSESGQKCKQDWKGPAWQLIRFESDSWGPERFRYGYRSTPALFEAIAIGDTDCDGDAVTLTLRVGGVRVSPRDAIQRTGED